MGVMAMKGFNTFLLLFDTLHWNLRSTTTGFSVELGVMAMKSILYNPQIYLTHRWDTRATTTLGQSRLCRVVAMKGYSTFSSSFLPVDGNITITILGQRRP